MALPSAVIVPELALFAVDETEVCDPLITRVSNPAAPPST